jgi:hypothetical protein
MTIELGSLVKDRWTGFQGIATGRGTYITGCATILVQPPVKEDGTWQESHWIDEPRLEVVGASRLEAPPSGTGVG